MNQSNKTLSSFETTLIGIKQKMNNNSIRLNSLEFNGISSICIPRLLLACITLFFEYFTNFLKNTHKSSTTFIIKGVLKCI